MARVRYFFSFTLIRKIFLTFLVHVNEPGRTEWEGFETATKAGAVSGITTIVDMPLNSIPPTTTVDNFETKLEAAKGKCFVDVAFWGGVIPGNKPDLKPLLAAGVKGFKCFLLESGVKEFPCVTLEQVKDALIEMQGTEGVLLFHAELDIPPAMTVSVFFILFKTFRLIQPVEILFRGLVIVD